MLFCHINEIVSVSYFPRWWCNGNIWMRILFTLSSWWWCNGNPFLDSICSIMGRFSYTRDQVWSKGSRWNMLIHTSCWKRNKYHLRLVHHLYHSIQDNQMFANYIIVDIIETLHSVVKPRYLYTYTLICLIFIDHYLFNF